MLDRLDFMSHPSADIRPVRIKTPIEKARDARKLKRLMAADPFKGVNHRRFGGVSVTRIDTETARKALGHCGLIPHNGPSVANRAPSRPTSIPRTRRDGGDFLYRLSAETFTPERIAPGAGDFIEVNVEKIILHCLTCSRSMAAPGNFCPTCLHD